MPLQFVAILLCVATLLPTAISRSVEIDVQAPWERHSLSFISELSEFLHDQQPRLFWQFADGMCQADNAHRIQGVATLQRHLQQLRNSTAADDATVQEQVLFSGTPSTLLKRSTCRCNIVMCACYCVSNGVLMLYRSFCCRRLWQSCITQCSLWARP